MVSQALNRVERERTALRGWWARERLTGTTLFLFSVRWAAWAVAAVIVILDVLPRTNVDREPVLLIGSFATWGSLLVHVIDYWDGASESRREDFVAYYAAASLVERGLPEAIYQPDVVAEVEEAVLGRPHSITFSAS